MMMKTMIPPQVGVRLQTLQKEKKGVEKKEKGQKKGKAQKKENKKGAMLLSFFPHLCFKVAP